MVKMMTLLFLLMIEESNVVLNPWHWIHSLREKRFSIYQNFTLQSCCSKLLKISHRKIQIILQGNACWVVRKSSLSCEEIVGEEAGRGVGSNLDRGRRKNAGTLLITLSASHTYTAAGTPVIRYHYQCCVTTVYSVNTFFECVIFCIVNKVV